MEQDQRIRTVQYLIEDFVKSPSLRHLRDPHSVRKLAQDIVRRIAGSRSIWTKWTEEREQFVKSITQYWVPVEDVREHLNKMEGLTLTFTDVEQRLRAFREEPFAPYPNEELREKCEAFYRREKEAGTELPAITGAMEELIYIEEQRLRDEWQKEREAHIKAEKTAANQRLLSGADCKWTPLNDSRDLYCRINGRLYRLQSGKDKRVELYQVRSFDDKKGSMVGTYQSRGDASKALKLVAYQPELRD